LAGFSATHKAEVPPKTNTFSCCFCFINFHTQPHHGGKPKALPTGYDKEDCESAFEEERQQEC
jgi:hypothetical protein